MSWEDIIKRRSDLPNYEDKGVNKIREGITVSEEIVKTLIDSLNSIRFDGVYTDMGVGVVDISTYNHISHIRELANFIADNLRYVSDDYGEEED